MCRQIACMTMYNHCLYQQTMSIWSKLDSRNKRMFFFETKHTPLPTRGFNGFYMLSRSLSHGLLYFKCFICNHIFWGKILRCSPNPTFILQCSLKYVQVLYQGLPDFFHIHQKIGFYKPSTNINQHQPTSNNITQHQPTSNNIKQHQPTSTNINQHQPTSNNIKKHQTK